MHRARGIRLEVLPQSEHEIIDRPGVGVVPELPDVLQELVATEDLVRVFGEVLQQRELELGQRQRLAVDGHLMRVEVDADRTELKRRGISPVVPGAPLPLLAPQQRTDASEELAELEGLGQIVIRAGLEAADAIQRRESSGQHDDGSVIARRAKLCAKLETVQIRKHHIEHDGAVSVGAHQKLRGPSRRLRDVNGESVELEIELQARGEMALVLDHEYPSFLFRHIHWSWIAGLGVFTGSSVLCRVRMGIRMCMVVP